ncbi:MAG: hypothetical protein ACI9MC_003014, partial [Kiritimatiellia bacterium]
MKRALICLWTLALSTSALAGTWRQDHADNMSTLRAAHPDLVRYVHQAQPTPARNGSVMFRQPRLNAPDAATVVLDRLLNGDDSDVIKGALASSWWASTDDPRAVQWMLHPSRPDSVRASAALHSRFATPQLADRILSASFIDPSARVRQSAVIALARRQDGARWTTATQSLLTDDNSGVRATAARTLGTLSAHSTELLVPMLTDTDATVRL